MNLENGSSIQTLEDLEKWYRQWDLTYLDERERVNRNRIRHRKKRERNNKYKAHLKFLAENSSYPHPAYAMDKNRNYIRWNYSDIAYYRRCYRGNHKNSASFYYKRRANRMVRRYKGEISIGSSYRKIFDYWWTLY